jgi:hypothetical protein
MNSPRTGLSAKCTCFEFAQDPNNGWMEVFCTHNEEPEEYKKIMEHGAKANGKEGART